MKPIRFVTQSLVELFEQRQAVTMTEMKTALGTAVDVTVFRKLAQLPYRTSYSHRGGFYTLDSIARFDRQGLWSCRGAWFSRYGTLLDTSEAFISHSSAGYFAEELRAALHVPVKDALRVLVQKHRVHRDLREGLYFYTAVNRVRRQQQHASREALLEVRDPAEEQLRAAIALFYSLLDEQQRRLYAGLESLRHGHGGDRQMARRLGMDVETVARGRQELIAQEVQRERVRRAGGGRPRAEKKRRKS